MSFTFRIDPVSQTDLQKRLARAGNLGRQASFAGRRRAARRIVATAKMKAPVDTGTLRASIHVATEKGPPGAPLATLAITADQDEVAAVADTVYATRQEFEHSGRKERLGGTSGQVVIEADPTPKKGYMRNSAAEHADDIVRFVAQELDRVLS